MRRHVTGAIAFLAVAAGAQAGVYSSGVLGNLAINNTLSNVPFNVPAGVSDPIRGFAMRGTWVAGTGGPWSSEFRASLDGSTERFLGGVNTGANFAHPAMFGPTYDNAGWAGDLLTGSPVSGAHVLGLRETFSPSTATLNNAEVLMLTDAVAPVSSALVANDPTFNRPSSLTTLSASGTAVRYKTHTFVAPSTGRYMLALDTRGGTTTDPDGFLCLYNSGGFNPVSPLTNLIGVDDDGGFGIGISTALPINLAAGQTYTAVVTSFGNGELGTYTMYIAGGEELQVPGPAGLALLGVAMGFSGRRRR